MRSANEGEYGVEAPRMLVLPRRVAGLLRAAADGRGGALVFSGDAGTGKSALLA